MEYFRLKRADKLIECVEIIRPKELLHLFLFCKGETDLLDLHTLYEMNILRGNNENRE